LTGMFKNTSMIIGRAWVAGIVVLLVLGGVSPSLAATVQVEAPAVSDYSAGETYSLRFRIRVAPLWSIHGAESSEDGMVPSRLSFPDSSFLRVTDVRFPAPEKRQFPYSKDAVEVLSGEFDVAARVVLSPDAPAGPQEITGAFSYQACSPTSCLPPESVPVTLSLRIVSSGVKEARTGSPVDSVDRAASTAGPPVTSSDAGTGLWLTLLGIFLGGLALNLTPCVYPLIPITVSYFGGKGGTSGKASLLQGLVYICGLAVTNSILGVTASLSGAMLGSVLQNPVVLLAVAGILVGLATSFFGLWEIRLPSVLNRLATRNYGGYFGTFFMGLTLGIVAAPCLGPFILGLLTYVGQKGDPFLGFVYFFVLSIGIGLPLAVLAFFSRAIERLPLSGGWMEWIRKVLGWVLVGMAGYLIQPLIPDPQARWTLLAGIVAAAGLHLGWLDRSRHRSPLFAQAKQGAGVLLIAGAAVLFFITPRHEAGVQWIPYTKAVLSEAARDQRPLIVDFYADWCGPCKAMERGVFTDPEVVQLSERFLPVRVDLTQRHADQDELLRRYQVRGVPTILFLDASGREDRGLRIESYVAKDEVLRRMREAAGLASR